MYSAFAIFIIFLQAFSSRGIPINLNTITSDESRKVVMSCQTDTQQTLQDMCVKSLFSCQGSCHEQPGYNRTCGCDVSCLLYDDCCYDFEFACPSLTKYKAIVDEKRLTSVCLQNGERVIDGCEDYREPVQKQYTMFSNRCTVMSHQYATESVMKKCTVFHSLECQVWDCVLPSRGELSLDGVKEKMRGYESHWKVHKNSGPNLFYTARACVKNLTLLNRFQLTQLERCQDYLSHQYNAKCSRDQHAEGDRISFDVELTELSKFTSSRSTGFVETLRENFTPIDDSQLLYTFDKNSEAGADVFVISSANSPHNTHFWKEIRCKLKTFPELEKYTIDMGDIDCSITKCEYNYYSITERCLKPLFMSITVKSSTSQYFENAYTTLKPIIETALNQQRSFKLRSIGVSVENENYGFRTHTDYYEVIETFQRDYNKTLLVSIDIYTDMENGFYGDIINSSLSVTVCLHFHSDEISPFKTCDNISFDGIQTTIANPTEDIFMIFHPHSDATASFVTFVRDSDSIAEKRLNIMEGNTSHSVANNPMNRVIKMVPSYVLTAGLMSLVLYLN